MSERHYLLASILLASIACVPARAEDAPRPDLSERARKFVEQLAVNQYDEAVKAFDTTMTRVMPADKLQDAWQSLLPQAGPFKEIAGIELAQKGSATIAVVTCRFEKTQFDIRVVYDADSKVSGLWFAPTPPPATPPPYADPDSYTEAEVTVGSGWWALPGTLTRPVGDGPFPAVVLVHGSGPNDRDETIGPNKPFRDLAWGLASKGIAVLRYEKRTKEHKLKMALLAGSLTVKEETIDDAVAAVETLRTAERIDPKRIFILGHSLGGMLVPRIAERDKKIAGFIILAGNCRPLEDLILEQLDYVLSLDAGLSEKDRETIATLEKQAARVKSTDLSTDTPRSELPFGAPPSYWLDLRGYDPARQATTMDRPLLILQGGRDYQVTMDDYAIWKRELSGRPNVTLHLYPECNHLFLLGEGPSTPAEYNTPGHVYEEVIQDIAGWINGER